MKNQFCAVSMSLGIIASAISSCNIGPRSIPQDGSVKFTTDGQSYAFDGMQFEIQPNLLNGPAIATLHKEVVMVKQGNNDFGFCIRTTQDAAEKQAKEKQQSHRGWRLFEFTWFAEAENPIDFVKRNSKITVQNARDHLLKIQLPETNTDLSTQMADSHTLQPVDQRDMWIQFDEMADNRVKGRFGSTVYAHPIGNALEPRQTSITDGQFDLPVVKLYTYE